MYNWNFFKGKKTHYKQKYFSLNRENSTSLFFSIITTELDTKSSHRIAQFHTQFPGHVKGLDRAERSFWLSCFKLMTFSYRMSHHTRSVYKMYSTFHTVASHEWHLPPLSSWHQSWGVRSLQYHFSSNKSILSACFIILSKDVSENENSVTPQFRK